MKEEIKGAMRIERLDGFSHIPSASSIAMINNDGDAELKRS